MTSIADNSDSNPSAARGDFRLPGILLGLGVGGFFDGIVLHQILQWHHMVSESYPPTDLANLQVNTLADGLFHAAAWIFTLAGIALLWRAARRARGTPPASVLAGLILAGWGLFNLVEGLVDHHLLAIHHVRPGPDALWWDLGFLAWGALMLAGGWLLARRGTAAAPASRPAAPARRPQGGR